MLVSMIIFTTKKLSIVELNVLQVPCFANLILHAFNYYKHNNIAYMANSYTCNYYLFWKFLSYWMLCSAVSIHVLKWITVRKKFLFYQEEISKKFIMLKILYKISCLFTLCLNAYCNTTKKMIIVIICFFWFTI